MSFNKSNVTLEILGARRLSLMYVLNPAVRKHWRMVHAVYAAMLLEKLNEELDFSKS